MGPHVSDYGHPQVLQSPDVGLAYFGYEFQNFTIVGIARAESQWSLLPALDNDKAPVCHTTDGTPRNLHGTTGIGPERALEETLNRSTCVEMQSAE